MAKLKYHNGSEWEQLAPTMEEFDVHLADNGVHVPHLGTTTNSGNSYSITSTKVINDGAKFSVKFNTAATGTATLKISSDGTARTLKKPDGNNFKPKAGVYSFIRDGENFQLLGEGGEYGNAQAQHVLSPYTIGTEDGIVTGTMPDRGAVSQSLPINGSYTIPAGYHNGSGKVTQSITTKAAATYIPSTSNQTIAAGQYLSGTQTIVGDADLVSANIKAGKSIFGVEGNANVVDTSAGDATASQILYGKKAYVDGALVTGTIPSKAAETYTPSTSNQTIAAGQYLSGDQTISAVTFDASKVLTGTTIAGTAGTMPNRGAVSQSLAINGSYTIPAGYHNGSGEVTQSIPTQGAQTITPGTSNKTIASGRYLTGTQTIAGDADLVAANIKSGKNIFGVDGSVVEATGNANTGDVLAGKTFSKAGSAGLTGTMANRGSQTATLSITGSAKPTKSISAGYVAASTITAQVTGQEANIKSGVTIGGCVGTLVEGVKGVEMDVWKVGAVAPASAIRSTSQLYNGKIYCPQSNGTAMHIYDIATDTWSTGAAAPASNSRNTSQLYNGKIYCPRRDGAPLHIYDIATDTWSTGAPAPTIASAARYNSQLYNGKIYCPQSGGTAMHIYDIAANTWSTGAAAPASASRQTSQLYNGKIYYPQSNGTALHIYDIATDTWTTGAVAPASAARTTSQLYNGKIYCPQSGGTALHIYDIATDTWTTGAVAPASATLSTSQLYNGKIYCPETGGTALNIYDIAANTWTTGAEAPASISRQTSQLYNGKIYCPQSLGTALHIYSALAFE